MRNVSSIVYIIQFLNSIKLFPHNQHSEEGITNASCFLSNHFSSNTQSTKKRMDEMKEVLLKKNELEYRDMSKIVAVS